MHEHRGIQFVTAVWFGGFADAFLLAERGRDMPLQGCLYSVGALNRGCMLLPRWLMTRDALFSDLIYIMTAE